MVQILPENPSFGTAMARALGGGIGQGVPAGIERYLSLIGERKKKLAKDLSSLSTDLSKELKARRRDTIGSRDFEKLLAKSRELIEQGYDKNEVFDQILSGHDQEVAERNQKRHVSGGYTDEERATKEYPYGVASYIKQHPGKAAADVGILPLSAAESLAGANPLQMLLRKLAGKDMIDTPLTDAAEKAAGFEELSEQGQKERSIYQLLPSLIPFERGIAALQGGASKVSKGFQKLLPNKAISPSEIIKAPGARQASPAARMAQEAETIASESKPLKGRVSAKPKETATDMRVERSRAREKLYPTEERARVREEQIKMHPRYVAEIEADATKRAAQAEARIPKTVKGMDAQRLRAVSAEKRLPQAQESYYKSIGRVRALEDEMASLPKGERERLEPLLKMARDDLNDASFNLKQASENLKGISYRASVDEMKAAARKKIDAIRDAVEAGEDYKLAKMDYNPEHLAEAKRISGKKPVPYSPKDDFYNQVHDTYLKEYRNELARLNEEISKLAKNPSLQSLSRRLQLGKQREILNKMIKSGEAERTIHKHKFGLREMSERAKAKERLAKFKRQEGNVKAKKLANEKMWKGRLEQIKTPEGRAKVAEEIVQDLSAQAKTPAEAEALKGAKTEFEGALGELNEASKNAKDKIKNPSIGNAAKDGAEMAKDFTAPFKKLLNKFPALRRFIGTKPGSDFIAGMATGIVDEMLPDEAKGFITGPVIAGAIVGRRRGMIGLGSGFAKGLIQQVKINDATRAYRRHDEEKFSSFSPSIRKKAKERANQ